MILVFGSYLNLTNQENKPINIKKDSSKGKIRKVLRILVTQDLKNIFGNYLDDSEIQVTNA